MLVCAVRLCLYAFSVFLIIRHSSRSLMTRAPRSRPHQQIMYVCRLVLPLGTCLDMTGSKEGVNRVYFLTCDQINTFCALSNEPPDIFRKGICRILVSEIRSFHIKLPIITLNGHLSTKFALKTLGNPPPKPPESPLCH